MPSSLLHRVPSIPITAVAPDELESLLAQLPANQRNWATEMDFRASHCEVLVLPDEQGLVDHVLFGLGAEDVRGRDRLIFGKLATALKPANYHLQEHPNVNAEQAALAWLLASYKFGEYGKDCRGWPGLVAPEGVNRERLETIAQSCHRAMELINRPANDLTIDALLDEIVMLASSYKAELTVTRGDELAKGFPLIQAVGQAGAQPPALASLAWGKASDPEIAIIGKGIVFDTGGLNIKPGSSMALMKKDMGGAANAIALAEMIMRMNLPIRLKLLIPIAENSIASAAFRPGDILTSRSGTTVEVNNTDAEGRLVLADAITYAKESNPTHIITLATLTGAARVALGPDIMPMYSTDDAFAEAVLQAGIKVEDPIWRMPFWQPYDEMLDTPNAQIDNAPAGGFAGSITAALFLKRFAGDTTFSHFDIYGWTPKAKPGRPFGGAAQAIRAIFESLESRFG